MGLIMTTIIKKTIETSIYGMIIDNCADSSGSVIYDGKGIYLNTIRGGIRKTNQDRLIATYIENQYCIGNPLFIVALADGMGGMVDGEKAASIAISSFISHIATTNDHGLKMAVFSAANYANLKVHESYHEKGGSTFSAIVFGKNGAVAVNVGDSRIYHVNSLNKLKQLTVDDTFSGQLAEEDSNCWENPTGGDNRLVQYMGMGAGLQAHVLNLPSTPKDGSSGYYLLSSDGLHYIGKIMMEKIIKSSPSEKDITARLINVSNCISGHDNGSLILVPDSLNFDTSDTDDSLMKLTFYGVEKTLKIILNRSEICKPNTQNSKTEKNLDASFEYKINNKITKIGRASCRERV